MIIQWNKILTIIYNFTWNKIGEINFQEHQDQASSLHMNCVDNEWHEDFCLIQEQAHQSYISGFCLYVESVSPTFRPVLVNLFAHLSAQDKSSKGSSCSKNKISMQHYAQSKQQCIKKIHENQGDRKKIEKSFEAAGQA